MFDRLASDSSVFAAITIEEEPMPSEDSTAIAVRLVVRMIAIITLVITIEIVVAALVAEAVLLIRERIIAEVVGTAGCRRGRRTIAIIREVASRFGWPFAAGAGHSFDTVRIDSAVLVELRDRSQAIGLGWRDLARVRS